MKWRLSGYRRNLPNMSDKRTKEFRDHYLKEASSCSNAPGPSAPKSTIFDNLGEAHQAITARMAPLRPAGQGIPPTPFPSPTSSFITLTNPTDPSVITRIDQRDLDDLIPSAEHLEFVNTSVFANGRYLPAHYAPVSRGSEDTAKPTDSPSDPREVSNAVEHNMKGDPRGVLIKRATRNTGSTVENIYNQYLPSTSAETRPDTQHSVTVVHSTESIFESQVSSGTLSLVGVDEELYTSHTGLPAGELSTGDFTADSDEDPFEYDRGSYTIFLKPAREREVSAALRCFSGASTGVNVGSAPASPGQAPVLPSVSPADAPQTVNSVSQHSNPIYDKLPSYQTPQVPQDWNIESGPNLVRVPVRYSAIPDQVVANQNQAAQRSEVHPPAENIEVVMSDGGDWETVGTTLSQFDSNRAFASDIGLVRTHPVKVTGSSIADYSDGNSLPPAPSDAFSSTDRILRHPSPHCDDIPRHRRTLRDSCRPIFPAKPRIHRVNGYLQNSTRLFTDPTTSSSGRSSARHHLIEKLSASIRSRTAKKRGQFWHLSGDARQWSKFGSHDSFGWFEMGRDDACSSQECQEDECPTTETPVNERNNDAVAEPSQQVSTMPAAAESTADGLEQGDTSTQADRSIASPTLFSFPLISLEEAARREASRIESGEDDLTITSGIRTQNDSSIGSSRVTQRTTPPTPHITIPIQAHCRHPTPAGVPSWAAPDPGYPRSMRDISPFTNPRSPPAAPRRLDIPRASLRRSFSFPTPPTVFGSPRLFRARLRDGGRRTTVAADLHRIANSEPTGPWGHLTDDAYLSWEARRRRKAFYYVMCILCILPFLAPLVYQGAFDSALTWYTKGETGRLSRRQRRRVLILGSAVSAVWLCMIAVVVTLAVNGGLA